MGITPRSCTVHHIDAFSAVPNQGNPAGVVVDTIGLDDAAMQAVATAVGFNETAFVLPSARADCRLRFFTPGHEMPLCGHATVASIFFLGGKGGRTREFLVETMAGNLPVTYHADTGMVTMVQAEPRFLPFAGSVEAVAEALGVSAADFRNELPVTYGSTGTWTLLVPVRSEGVLRRMTPDNRRFPDLLTDMPRASVHPFAVADGRDGYDVAARHFSSPYSGTVEDPVTGSAAGVMGAYALRHLPGDPARRRLVVSQGASVGRDGRVYVDVARRDGAVQVSVSGYAVTIGSMDVSINS